MLSRLATVLSRVAERYVPGALAIAVLLTAVVSALALLLTPAPVPQVVEAWGSGLWSLNGFAMQMCVVVLTGYLVSTAPVADRALGRVARLATSPRGAVTLMALVSMTLAWVHWGMSLVAGATLVRHLRRAQPGADYRLLVASAYLGMGTTWHAGLSGSAPLLVATPGHFLADRIGVIPVGATIFHPFNLSLVAIVMVVMTLIARGLTVWLPVKIAPGYFNLPRGAGVVLTWGGLRGGISVALALSLPQGPARDVVLTLTYGIVVFSILMQGLTIGHVASRAVRVDPAEPESNSTDIRAPG